MWVVKILVALLAIVVAVFVLQNLDPVTVRFLVWRIDGLPLALVILLSGIAFALPVGLLGLMQRWKLRAQMRQITSHTR